MNANELKISVEHAAKLLKAANPDAALLYLYLQCGNAIANAEADLNLSAVRMQCAAAMLRQAGLWEDRKPVMMVGERPAYSERDVLSAVH